MSSTTTQLEGTVWKYGEHINTDVILPARYLNLFQPEDLVPHCMEDLDKSFARDVQPGDIIVAGENYGCGSSREHAPIAIKASGVSCIIAASFARIFFRNAINIGLPLFEHPEAAHDAKKGDRIRVNLLTGEIHNMTQQKSYHVNPLPPFIQNIIQAGGLMPYVKNQLAD